MDLVKVGSILKKLRKKQGLTQEQLAKYLNVTSRTISRWETGSNLPDIEILMQLSDFYHVDLRTILSGESEGKIMDSDLKETVLQVSEYKEEEKKILKKRLFYFFIFGIILSIIKLINAETTWLTDIFNLKTSTEDFINGFIDGVILGILILGALYTSKYFDSFREKKLSWIKSV